MDSDEWESDEEFEATILDMEKQESSSKVTTVFKIKSEPIAAPMCSTPLTDSSDKVAACTSPTHSGSLSSISLAKSPTTAELCATSTPMSSASHPAYVSKELGTKATAGRKRKFPGPAGTLPKLKRDVDMRALKDVPVEVEADVEQGEELLTSQGSQPLSVSSYTSWRRMVEETGISKEHLHKHSISNALTNVGKRQLPDGKVPLLATVIVSINKTLPDATVTLKDLTGCINGVIHRLLVKQYHEQLKLGSALLLKHVAVFSPSRKRQYLNITPNNLLQIYSEHDKTAEIECTQVAKPTLPLDTLLTQPVSTLRKEISCSKAPSGGGNQPLAERVNCRTVWNQNKIYKKTWNPHHPNSSRLSNQNVPKHLPANQITLNDGLTHKISDSGTTINQETASINSSNQRAACPTRLTNEMVHLSTPSLNNTNQHLFEDDDLDEFDLDF